MQYEYDVPGISKFSKLFFQIIIENIEIIHGIQSALNNISLVFSF